MCFDRSRCVRVSAAFVACLAAVPPSFSQEVVLPLEDYESLRRRAEPEAAAAPAPSVPIALESVELDISVGHESARVTARMSVTLYDDRWQSIALPADTNLTSVELGALEGRVTTEPVEGEESSRVLVCRGAGRHDLRFEAVVPVHADSRAARPTRSVVLMLPFAGMVTGVVRSDTESDSIVFDSGALDRDAAVQGGRSFVGKPGAELRIELLGESDLAVGSGLPLVFGARSAAVAHVSRGSVALTGFVELDVVQGEMETLRVQIPQRANVLSVRSPEDAELGWDIDGDGDLVVRFAAPITGRHAIELSLEGKGATPDKVLQGLDELESPLLVVEGASHQTLVSGLSVDEDGIPVLVRALSARRARQEDVSFLPSSMVDDGVSLFVIREASEPPAWRVEWAEGDPVAVLASQVDRLIVDTLVGESGKLAHQYWAVVRSSGALSLTLRPPDGFELIAATRSGRRVTPGRSARGLEIPLSAGPEPQVVYLSGITHAAPPPGKGVFDVPLPSLSSPVAEVEVRAVLPGRRRYRIASSNVRARIGSLPEASPGSRQGKAVTWFPVPDGHTVVTASWSALSAAPRSLSLRATPEREKRRWY